MTFLKEKNKKTTNQPNHKIEAKAFWKGGGGGGKSKQNEYSAKETEKASSSMKLSNLEERPSSAQTSIENKS